MNASIEHQDNSGRRHTQLGVFRDGVLLGTVADWSDEHEIHAVATKDGGTDRGVEVLTVCWRHPDTAAVDCTTCAPVEEGT